jgi:cyclophilin family peptidyl-prolyl cis-trans isomerase
MNTKHISIAILAAIIGISLYVGLSQSSTPPEQNVNIEQKNDTLPQGVSTAAPGTENIIRQLHPHMKATIETSKGTITLELMSQDAPNTVANFVKLAKEGFYDGTKFHRVIKGFMIQGGDPLTKDDSKQALWGTGGPGYRFGDEIHANNHNNVGTISMANAGPNTNGSQFFINVNNNNFLDTKHTTFGTITTGMDVVTTIENVQTGQQDRPTEPVTITRVTVE